MKVVITKASDSDYEQIQEFDSLEQLLEFVEKTKYGSVIVTAKSRSFLFDTNFSDIYDDDERIEKEERLKRVADCECEVMIYDDFVE